MSTFNMLLVDDDRILATTLSHGLRRAMGNAISVDFCASGREAFALLATRTFDLVISDFHMPGTSGLKLLKQVKSEHPETSLVLITAYGTDALEEEVHQLGIRYITKPFEPPLLVQLIQDLVRSTEAARTSAGTENTPHLMIAEPQSKVLADADPAVPN